MLLVRRRAPEGSYFADGDRASGVFGVLATGFSVLLGFIVFLAFSSYDQSRLGAEEEALVLSQQVETAQFFPDPTAGELTGQLVCYGRSVVNVEWPHAESGTQETSTPGASRCSGRSRPFSRGPRARRPPTPSGSIRPPTGSARIDRIHGAVGVIPSPLWVVLLFLSVVIFVYMLFFADSGERAVTQALLMGAVACVVVALLLLIRFLDSPFNEGVGGVRPVAMERTLDVIDEASRRWAGDPGDPTSAGSEGAAATGNADANTAGGSGGSEAKPDKEPPAATFGSGRDNDTNPSVKEEKKPEPGVGTVGTVGTWPKFKHSLSIPILRLPTPEEVNENRLA